MQYVSSAFPERSGRRRKVQRKKGSRPDQTRQAVLTPSLPTLQHIYFGLAVDTLSFLGTQIPETIHLITFTSKRLL